MTFTANEDQSEPKSCKRFEKRMLLNAKFVAHLPACGACMKVVAQLNRESELARGLKVERRADFTLKDSPSFETGARSAPALASCRLCTSHPK